MNETIDSFVCLFTHMMFLYFPIQNKMHIPCLQLESLNLPTTVPKVKMRVYHKYGYKANKRLWCRQILTDLFSF